MPTMRVSEANGVRTISLEGKLVIGTDNWSAPVMELVRENRPIVLDLSAVTTIDSNGMGQLTEIIALALNYETPFVLSSTSEKFRELAKICRLDEVVKVYDSPASARAALER